MRTVDTLFGHPKTVRHTGCCGSRHGLKMRYAMLRNINPFLVGPELLDAPA